MKEFEGEKEAGGASPIWDCGSPLYDSYELVTLSHMIERHMVVWPHLGGSKKIITPLSDPHEVMISTENAKGSSKLTSLSEFLGKIMGKRKLTREGKGNNHKKTKTGFSGFYNRLICGGNSVQ